MRTKPTLITYLKFMYTQTSADIEIRFQLAYFTLISVFLEQENSRNIFSFFLSFHMSSYFVSCNCFNRYISLYAQRRELVH